ncbi:hypothetical protein JCM1393_08670 [Clostridium carnis]
MTKEMFLNILKDGLSDFPAGELSDILYDYKEHFDVGFASGKTEENIIEELGNPYDIVNQYRNGYLQKYKEEPVEEEESYNDYTEDKQDTFNAEYKASSSSNSTNVKRNNNNIIITVIIIVLSLFLFGPVIGAIAISILAIIVSVIVGSLGLSIGGIGILIGKVVTNTVGAFVFPAFILDFPSSVIGLMVIGCILLFIFSILCSYYFIKLCVILVKKFIFWISPNEQEEK